MIFWLGSLLLLQFTRLFFLLRSASSFEGLSFWDFTRSFAYGFRFDASALAYLFLAILALEIFLFVFAKKFLLGLPRFFKVLGVSLFYLVSMIDAEYFLITNKRLDASILSISSDIKDQAPQLASHYSYILMSFLFVFFVFWHIAGRDSLGSSSRRLSLRKVFSFLFVVPMAVLFARGGFQEKPIKLSSAMSLGSARLINLAMSTPFSAIQSVNQKDSLRVYRDYSQEEAYHILSSERPGATRGESLLSPHPSDNVVVIILESFGLEYSSFTPFLNSLKQRGISFENHYANGRTSIEAIPALLAGLPSMMPNPYITSKYVNTQLTPLASLRSTASTQSRDFLFFHGARRGSMYFDSFTAFAGFPHYFAKEDYTGDSSALYDWGVHDHAFLDFTGKKLSEEKSPFVAAVFTLSSHQPFEIPSSFSTSLAEAPTPYTRSLRYSDRSLQLFFEKYQSAEWFKKTLFILTGDHTSQCKGAEYCSQTGGHRVPLSLYHGAENLGGLQIQKVTQHADIPATIADYLALDPSPLVPFGKSVLDVGDKGIALLNAPGEYSAVMGDSYYRLSEDSFLRCPLVGIAETQCTAAAQSGHNSQLRYLKAARSYFTQSLEERNFKAF
ncbi:MAG: sulfatase-like hydrolase/transferase [Bdellovibrionota bacterium]